MKGEAGETGVVGPAGPNGEDGKNGEDSSVKGNTGQKGGSGTKGSTGVEGPTGIRGESGPDGDIGAAGENGLPGKDGRKGEPGVLHRDDSKYILTYIAADFFETCSTCNSHKIKSVEIKLKDKHFSQHSNSFKFVNSLYMVLIFYGDPLISNLFKMAICPS